LHAVNVSQLCVISGLKYNASSNGLSTLGARNSVSPFAAGCRAASFKTMRTLKATVAALVLIGLSACATAHVSAAPTVKTTALARPAVARKPMPAGCALALASLPASPPVTLAQSDADMKGLFAVAESLAGPVRGTPVSERSTAVAEQSTLVGLALDLPDHPQAVATWEKDAESLRSYCRS
jgi:hypothetical protein